ncbi:MAG: FecR family protein [Ghiorsea sp.]|nr:FecR family protein [Ghiorsea sp.]MDQ7004854.1 FecR family protein [Ghiorsea sp.]
MLKILTLTIAVMVSIILTPTTQAYAAASIGRIVHTYGPAWVLRGAIRERATKGQVVLRNDSIVTGSRGRVKIMMGDGSKVYIGAKSRISLRKYSMRGGKLFSARINMLWGKARFFVNKLTIRDSSFRVRTPTAVLGVRGTWFVTIVPPTPEVLDRAFDNLTLNDIPPLPTRTVLIEGVVDVSAGDSTNIEVLRPGYTAHVDKNGKVNIKETKRDDADIKSVNPNKENLDTMRQDSTHNEPIQKEDLDIQTKPHLLAKENELPKSLMQQGISDSIQGSMDSLPTEVVNAIQNLDNMTEIIIQPSFVTPKSTIPLRQ